jgi:signal transduction histidine kinase
VHRRIAGLAAAAVVVGLAAEHTAFGWADAADWVPDVLVGWTLIAAGTLAWLRRSQSSIGMLIVASGFAWFVGNFAAASWAPAAWIGAHLLYVHRGPLIHCLLSFPTGRPASWHARVVVATGYLASVVTPLGRSDMVTLALAPMVVASATWGYLGTVGRDRRAQAMSLPAALLFGVSLAVISGIRLAYPAGEANARLLLGYELVLAAVGVGLTAALVTGRWERTAVTELVVALSEDRSATLRDALGRALGDPSLQIGYRLGDSDTYVDADGRSVEIPHRDPRRDVTRVGAESRPPAILIHDSSVLRDPGLVRSVASAAELAASNARLQAEVRTRLAELAASRARLLAADDDERARLEHRLRAGAEHHLIELADILDDIREHAENASAHALVEPITRARDRLDQTLADLRQTARGLNPRILTRAGLAAALDELADGAQLPVTVSLPAMDIPADVSAAAYFLCAEAISNAEKHASATDCAIVIEQQHDRLVVEVTDDGVGGADMAAGSGLRGLADRIHAIGGTFTLRSVRGKGTTVTAEVPLDL